MKKIKGFDKLVEQAKKTINDPIIYLGKRWSEMTDEEKEKYVERKERKRKANKLERKKMEEERRKRSSENFVDAVVKHAKEQKVNYEDTGETEIRNIFCMKPDNLQELLQKNDLITQNKKSFSKSYLRQKLRNMFKNADNAPKKFSVTKEEMNGEELICVILE